MNQIETTINEYMTQLIQRLAGASNRYHSLEIEARIFKGVITLHRKAYREGYGHITGDDLDAVIDKMLSQIDTRSESQIKRDTAAKLMAEADALEAEESAKNQPVLSL